MKWSINFMLLIGLISLITSCGKNNESGLSQPFSMHGNPFHSPLASTPFSLNGVNLQEVIRQNPCHSSSNNSMWGTFMPYSQLNTQVSQGLAHRMQITVPLTNFHTQISPGDIYVGVTSYGDVAVVTNQNGTTQPGLPQTPVFVAYLCPRTFTSSGQGVLQGVQIGANTPNCFFKPIVRATVIFPGGSTAQFRWLDGRSSTGQQFVPPVCRQTNMQTYF